VSANAAAEVSARLKVIADLAAAAAPKAAVEAMSRAGETMTKLVLQQKTHRAGTPTPSRPGQPPAKVSGDMARAVHRTPSFPSGPARYSQRMGCLVIYGSVHEFGPVVITAQNFPQLGNPRAGFFGPEVTIPRRPWMKPSMEHLIASGLGTKAAALAFQLVIGI
jgi:hypothetical protein